MTLTDLSEAIANKETKIFDLTKIKDKAYIRDFIDKWLPAIGAKEFVAQLSQEQQDPWNNFILPVLEVQKWKKNRVNGEKKKKDYNQTP